MFPAENTRWYAQHCMSSGRNDAAMTAITANPTVPLSIFNPASTLPIASEIARPTTGTPLLSRNFPVFSASVSALCANIPCRPMSAPNTVAQNVSSHFVHRHTEAVNCERSSVLPTAAVAFSASSTRVSGSPTLHRISAITIAAPKKKPLYSAAPPTCPQAVSTEANTGTKEMI